MRSEESMLELHAAGVESKNHALQEHGQRDMNPQVAYIFEGQEEPVFPPMPPDNLMELMGLPRVLHDLVSMVGVVDDLKIREFWLLVDGHAKTSDEGSRHPLSDDYKRGDLAKDFSENLESKVTECLLTYCFSDDLVGGVECQSVYQPYSLGDYGVFDWKEPVYVEADMHNYNGEVVKAVVEAWPKND